MISKNEASPLLDPKVQAAFDRLQEVFNKIPHSTKPPEQLTQLQVTATLLVSKTMRTTRALHELWRIGLAEDMGSLTRGIVESLVVLQYLNEKGTEREVLQFAAKAEVKNLEQAETMIRLFPKSRSAQALLPQMPQLREKAKYVKETYLNDGKRPKGYEAMAKEIGLKEFEIIYPDLSGYVHPDSASASHYVKRHDKVWRVLLEEPNYDQANSMARIALVFVVGVIEHYVKIHDLNVAESEFKSILDKLD